MSVYRLKVTIISSANKYFYSGPSGVPPCIGLYCLPFAKYECVNIIIVIV